MREQVATPSWVWLAITLTAIAGFLGGLVLGVPFGRATMSEAPPRVIASELNLPPANGGVRDGRIGHAQDAPEPITMAAATDKTIALESNVLHVAARTVMGHFIADRAQARRKYLKKQWTVTGEVHHVFAEGQGDTDRKPHLSLRVQQPGVLNCWFGADDRRVVEELKPGQLVTIRGFAADESGSHGVEVVWLHQCKVLD